MGWSSTEYAQAWNGGWQGWEYNEYIFLLTIVQQILPTFPFPPDPSSSPHTHPHLPLQIHPRPIFTRQPLRVPTLSVESGNAAIESQVLLKGIVTAALRKRWVAAAS